MFKPHAFSLYAATACLLLLGTVFSTPLFAGSSIGPLALPYTQASPQAVTSAGTPKEIYANTYRAYPPSCLNDGLPLGKSSADPNAQTLAVTLYTYDSAVGGYITEPDSVTIWRVPCSGGTSATLMEIDRSAANNGTTTQYPLLPAIYMYPSASPATVVYPRIAQEPNTLLEDTAESAPIYSDSVYVLEYYAPSDPRAASQANYNQAFSLYLASQAGGTAAIINVPAFTPPTAPAMEITGYMSTNWSSPTQSGEGIVTQVYDDGDKATRTLAFAWFTYDKNNLPFWLYGQVSFAIGATQVTAPTVYFNGGTFAGTLPSGVPNTSWGTVTFNFPDCDHMNIAYSGDASAVNGPTGNATATYTRVANVNSLVCE